MAIMEVLLLTLANLAIKESSVVPLALDPSLINVLAATNQIITWNLYILVLVCALATEGIISNLLPMNVDIAALTAILALAQLKQNAFIQTFSITTV